jgi:hypothetical protein
MISGENRRTFLSAILLAGGSAAAFAESYRSAVITPPAGSGDPLFEHIQQQLANALRAANARGAGPGAEDAAAAAACMRVCGTHARVLNIDQVARDALARRNRTALIESAADLTTLRSRLRRKGLVISDRLAHAVRTTSPDVRAAALDSIRNGRTTLVCDRLAEALDVAAPRLAETEGPVRRVSQADQWWCNFFLGQWSMYLALAWSYAALDDGTYQAFIDSMWAGFVFYDELYTANC